MTRCTARFCVEALMLSGLQTRMGCTMAGMKDSEMLGEERVAVAALGLCSIAEQGTSRYFSRTSRHLAKREA